MLTIQFVKKYEVYKKRGVMFVKSKVGLHKKVQTFDCSAFLNVFTTD